MNKLAMSKIRALFLDWDDTERRRMYGDDYADGFLDGQGSADELLVAAEAYAVKHGLHEGPCTNVDSDGAYNGDACDLHIEAGDRRNERLLTTIREFKEMRSR